jgi:hypothetical protein
MDRFARREFIRISAAGLAATGLIASPLLAEQKAPDSGIPTRPLGKTGERIPIVGPVR